MTDKKRVLVVGALPPPYMGPTLATQVILNSSLSKCFDIIHLDASDHREVDTLGLVDFTNIYVAVSSYFRMLYILLLRRPDLVYMQISQTTIGYLKDSVYIILAKIFRIKVLCHLRGGNFRNWYDSCKGLTKWYIRSIHSLVNGQIVLGECLRVLFQGIVESEQIYVVPNGKDVNVKVDQVKTGVKTIVLFTANMRRSKGVIDVLNAIPSLCKKFINIEFHFAGAWSESDVKEEILLFLKDNPGLPIIWRGKVVGQEKDHMFCHADIFVFPTYYPAEGHPWVIVEAMAAGLPIVSTDHAAITESVIDGENGIIVEKRNAVAVATALGKLVEDVELRRRMGGMSRELYQENFTEAKMIEHLSLAFEKVLSD